MTVYIDIIFLENFIMNLIIIYATSLICTRKIKIVNAVLASFIGSIYAVTKLYFMLKTGLDLLIISIIMNYIVFKPKNIREGIKVILYFYITSFIFGGVVLSLMSNFNVGTSLNVIIYGGIIAFFIIFLLTKFYYKSKKNLLYDIVIEINGKKLNLTALMDTGNFLKDPLTKNPVVVVEYFALNEIIPIEILKNIENIIGGDLKKIPNEMLEKYETKLKIIPFSSLGMQNGRLLGIKADNLIIKKESEEKNVDKVIIGLYTKKLSPKNEYSALLGYDII